MLILLTLTLVWFRPDCPAGSLPLVKSFNFLVAAVMGKSRQMMMVPMPVPGGKESSSDSERSRSRTRRKKDKKDKGNRRRRESSSPRHERVSRPAAPKEPPSQWEIEIHRGAKYLKTLPRVRLSEIVEAMVPDLDAAATANLSVDGLVSILYIVTRMGPVTRISTLRNLGF